MKRSAIQTPLCDGLARGRLSIAEICGLEQEELDALCELGAEKLELGLIDESLSILAGLIALYPFDARFWRCYAVALHQAGHLHQAQHACEAALLLDPDSPPAQHHLALLSQQLSPQVKPESPAPQSEPTGFSLQDGTTLPLSPSTYPAPVTPAEVTKVIEPTQLSPPPRPTPEATEITEVFPTKKREITRTAIVRRRPIAPREAPVRLEGTQTAIIKRKRGHGVIEAASEDTLESFFDSAGEEPAHE